MLRVIKVSSFILLLLSVVSCSGYRFINRTNPFQDYGIKSISIPMFKNTSIIPGLEGYVTQEIYNVLSRYPGLRIISGEDLSADAILVGVVGSAQKRYDTYTKASSLFITEGSDLGGSIGQRSRFYLPNTTAYQAGLRLVLIKNPTKSLIDLAKSELGGQMVKSPTIIFTETIGLSSAHSRAILANQSVDEGGVANNTNTRQIFRESLRSVAINAANSFKSLVIDAF